MILTNIFERLKTIGLVACAVFIVFTTALQSTVAGKYVLVKSGTWTGEHVLPGNDEICRAYERNLKKFQHLPYAMACERHLDTRLGFTQPKWNRLDPKQYIDLVRSIYIYFGSKTTLTNAEILKRVSENRFAIELSKIDVDKDGLADNLIRFGSAVPCDPKPIASLQSSFGNKRLILANKQLTGISKHAGSMSGKDNVFSYKGEFFTDRVIPGHSGIPIEKPKDGQPIATLLLGRYGPLANTSICQYTFFETD